MKLKFYFLFFTVVISLTVNAQGPDWSWTNRIGGAGNEANGGQGVDGGHTIASDADGNVYVTGHFSSATLTLGSTTLTSAGSEDIFIVKYDSAGAVVWARNAGGSDYDLSYGIAVDMNGNVFITGAFESSVITFGSSAYNNVNGSGNYEDIFIAKYDAAGNFLWAHTAGNTFGDFAKCISVDAAGCAYISGAFGGSSLTFGTHTVTGNHFLTKYDPSGNVVWARGGSPGSPNPYSNAVDADANIYVVGTFFSPPAIFGNDTLVNASGSGTADVFIVKYDSSGNVLWARGAGGTNADMGYSVCLDTSGNAYITGGSVSATFPFASGTFVNSDNTASSFDVFILKYDAAGNEVWVQSAGGMGDDAGLSMTSDPDDKLYITGYFYSTSVTFGSLQITNTAMSTAESFVVQLTNAGTFTWAKGITGTGTEWGRSITSNPLGDIYTNGTFTSSAVAFGNLTMTNTSAPNKDTYVAKIGYNDLTLRIPFVNTQASFAVYPNPAQDNFMLTPPASADVYGYTVTTLSGQVLTSQSGVTGTTVINTEQWSNGTYFVSVTCGTFTDVRRISVCR